MNMGHVGGVGSGKTSLQEQETGVYCFARSVQRLVIRNGGRSAKGGEPGQGS